MAEQRRFIRRRKYCKFCAQKIEHIDYKNVELLKPFISERGRIIPKRISGVCSKHQRQLAKAVKRARHLALLPFVKVD
ncbi:MULTISPECIES: 30S ribosomal protein S18 [unclassified Desulfurobacterium]|uniref:30S ribosomal protein S18 n=1 Tax=unclassified Desulfurobacterium TaxID=2639089 RepID=UPI0003B3118F|nr:MULTISPECIES: 30S ribosomal protein S18 [unclassified Desulfurobacterium]